MSDYVHVIYKQNYKNFIPEERINNMINSYYNIKQSAECFSIIFENTRLEPPANNDFLEWDVFEFEEDEANKGFNLSEKSFAHDYLKFLDEKDAISFTTLYSTSIASMLKARYSSTAIEKEMEFENELSEHYLIFNIGYFKITPLCEINNQILNILTDGNVHFLLEEHNGIIQPFYRIFPTSESFYSNLCVKTGSLDFKNDGLFINSLIKMLENNNIKGFSFDQVKEAPLEYLQMIQVLKY